MIADLSDLVELTEDLEVGPSQFTLTGLARRLPLLVAMASDQSTAKEPTLQRLYDDLIRPLRIDEHATPMSDCVEATIVDPGTADAATAAAMLDWGYCSHYYTGEGEPELPPEPTILRARTHTLAATLRVGEDTIMLGTLQVVIGPTVPALSLFGPVDTSDFGMVGELRRFSVSPLLEVAADDYVLGVILRDYRSQIYRGLYNRSLEILRDAGVETIYGIATPEIYRFFTRSGMPMRRLHEMVLRDSAEMRRLRYRFARYWRPYAPAEQQPALYQILYPEDAR